MCHNPQILLRQFLQALEEFYDKDKLLIKYKVAERALTHKLAEYLQKKFHDYNVDCEYNKVGEGDPKRVMELISRMCQDGLCYGDCEQCRKNKCVIFPDIIVHHRGKDDNLLVIEAKTSWSNSGQGQDFKKLQALIDSGKYQYILGIAFRFDSTFTQTVETIKIFCDESEKCALYEVIRERLVRTDGHEIEDGNTTRKVQNTTRRSPFRFSMCGIDVGAEVTFVGDESKKAVVVDDRHVRFANGTISLSALAKQLLGSKHPVPGTLCFKCNGKIPYDIRKEREVLN